MVLSFVKRKGWHSVAVLRNKYKTWKMRKCLLFHSGISDGTDQDLSQSCSWRVLFFGTDEFALQSFKLLNERYASKQLIKRLEIVTAYKGKENPVIAYAKQNGILVHSWPLKISPSEFDVGLVVSFGHMIPTEVINSFPLGMINVHASLLPKLRGAAPIIHALMNGDSETGVTIMKIMPLKFDIGEIILQQKVIIHPDETMPQLFSKLAACGAELLIRAIEKLPGILSQGQKQDDNQATYAKKIIPQVASIRWDEMNAKNVYDLQRALTGLYPLVTKFEEKKIKLLGIRICDRPEFIKNNHEKSPGFITYNKQKNLLLVKCKDESWISTEKIIVPGHKPMSAKDFKNGFMSKYKLSATFLSE